MLDRLDRFDVSPEDAEATDALFHDYRTAVDEYRRSIAEGGNPSIIPFSSLFDQVYRLPYLKGVFAITDRTFSTFSTVDIEDIKRRMTQRGIWLARQRGATTDFVVRTFCDIEGRGILAARAHLLATEKSVKCPATVWQPPVPRVPSPEERAYWEEQEHAAREAKKEPGIRSPGLLLQGHHRRGLKPSLDDYDNRREMREDGTFVPYQGRFGIFNQS